VKVCSFNRDIFYELLHVCFKKQGIQPLIAELGVLKGDNADAMNRLLKPQALYLIDQWLCADVQSYASVNGHRFWVEELNTHTKYYGGPLDEQSTFDNLYDQVASRFADDDHVYLLRDNTVNAYYAMEQLLQDQDLLNLIYIDANHQFESVFDDLMFYQNLLGDFGALQLNDCCHSELGFQQNLGVLEAVVKFVKATDFVPVAMTNTDWSDLILIRRSSPLFDMFSLAVDHNQIRYVEVPPQLLGQAAVKGDMKNISFL